MSKTILTTSDLVAACQRSDRGEPESGKSLPDAGTGRAILTVVLSNLKRNVVDGVRDAQRCGIAVVMPELIEVDMALDADGLPCGNKDEVCCARLKTVLRIKE